MTKKIIAIVLAMTMMFLSIISVFAEETASDQFSSKYEKYNKVIEKYINSAPWEWPCMIQIDEINIDCELYSKHDLDTVGYVLKDIDNNGVDELLVGPTDNNGEIYTAFSLVDGDLVLLFMSWSRNHHYLLDSGNVLNNGSGGAFLSVWYNEAISDNKRDMVIQDGVIADGVYAESIGAKEPWFKATTSNTDDYVNISEQKARDTIDSWECSKIHIEYIPLSKYTNDEHNNSIAILTSEKSFGIKTGETMELAFGLFEGETGLLNGEWRKMAVTVSDSTIVSLSDYRKGEHGYFIDVTGKKEGLTHLTITDTETGVATQIIITVSDDFVKTYSYNIEIVEPFYPNNRWEKDIATNIYNLNGIYINDYACEKTSTGYNVSFNAYNEEYHIGAVDIYDKNGNWLGSEEIEKFTDISSVWDTGEQLVYLVNDIRTHRMITYEQSSSTKHTPIKFFVPEGGYFVISNNYFESPGTYLFNTTEILYEAMTDFADIVGEFVGTGTVTSSEFLELVKDEFNDDPTLREAFVEVFTDTAINQLQQVQKDLIKGDINTAYAETTDLYEDIMKSIDFNWKDLMETGAGFGEGVFKKLAGPAGVALSVCFTFSKKTSQFHQAVDIGCSVDEPCATFYSQIEEGYVNPYGIVVNTNGNIDGEAVLQVFRVSDSDVIEVVLDDDNPLQQHQLYNISFVKDDKLVQPNGKVTVRIPIPTGMQTNTCKVYRQEENGRWTVIDARVEGNYLMFETDHFSYYAVVGDSAKLTVVSVPKKLKYVEGEELDTAGLTLKYNNQAINDGYICTPSVLSGYGTKTITIRYGSAIGQFEVDVSNGLLGDTDSDGEVTVMDATAIQMHVAKLQSLTASQSKNGDTDGDGEITIMDATEIQMFVAKLIPALGERETITLSSNQLTMNVGEKKTLTATVKPSGLSNSTVTWSSSNSSIVSVVNGVVEAKGLGTATITAKTKSGVTAKCTIMVKDKTVEVSSIKLNSNGISLNEGNTYQLVATVIPENATNKTLTWSTSDASVATVSGTGKITAVSIGKATITAKSSNGVTITCAVSVVPIQVSSITLSDTNEVLYLGFTHFLTATVKPDNANDKSLTWSSSNTSVVTVSSSGAVTAKGLGTATVTARASNGVSASCVFTVCDILPDSMTLSKNTNELDVGQSFQLKGTITPSYATNKTITWSSSDTSVATVTQSGNVKAVGNGKATITAKTVNGIEETCEIIVYTPVSGTYELFLNLRKNPAGCYRLTADDTLNTFDLNIDTFTGCINGDGHTITIAYDSTSNNVTNNCYKALLPKTNGAIIKNLNISGTIDHEMYSEGSYSNYCAGFVAYAENTTFVNCTNEAMVKSTIWSNYSGYGYVGGITAWSNNCNFTDCTNKGGLQATTMPVKVASSIAGGISGQSSGCKFDSCSNSGNVYAHSSNSSDTYYSISYSGGIIGSSNSNELNRCVTSGNMMAYAWPEYETYYTSVAASGGIIAYGNGKIENCSSSCKLNPSATNGGVIYKGDSIAYKN